MTCNAEKYGLIAKELYESRKKHCGTDHTLNKVLSNDLLKQLKQSGAICSNDAKSCYDLITHTPASLSMQGFGVTKSFVVCMLETLQNTNHQVWTAYGDSDLSYQGSAQIIPKNRIGQGNGVRPAIWVVVSMPSIAKLIVIRRCRLHYHSPNLKKRNSRCRVCLCVWHGPHSVI